MGNHSKHITLVETTDNQPAATLLNATVAKAKQFQAMSTMIIQVNHTNQALMTWLTSQSQSTGTISDQKKDSKIHSRSFSGLPTEDVLAWLDHFDLVVGYHDWNDERKALELRIVLEHVAAMWFIQQLEEIKNVWHYLREQLIQHFTNNDVMQSTLQQLNNLR